MSGGLTIEKLIAATCETIDRHAKELTALDQAIGDGDHGINMKRGFDAIKDEAHALKDMEFGAALKKAGMTLVMKVGGASGPLYGSALMDMGQSISAMPGSQDSVAAMLGVGIEAVKKRGKSDAGAKTMLDVMVPLRTAIADGADLTGVRAATDAALEATRAMLATKGRAAFLGERSIGHIDPGARSTALLVHAVCDVLEAS